MGIVKFALRFPHTFYVLAILILFLGVSAIKTTPTDIFPQIRIPVVSVIWQYTGLSPDEMEARVATYSEYSISSTVNGIKNMESETLSGLVVQKIYFQPNVNLELAISQIVSATNSIRALMPTGINPPVIVQFNASSVPILQLSLTSDRLNEQQLYDYGIYQVRQQLAPVPGITLPTPYGGKYRQIMVDLDPQALLAQGLTPIDVTNAVNAQNLTVPSGDAKIGDKQYIVRLNAQPPTVAALNDIPIRQVNGTTVYLRDVAHVRDAWAVQQNIVRTGGKRSVLLTIIKNGEASTLDVVKAVKEALPGVRAAAPPGMEIKELFDQSVFVSDSINSVLREGAIAAGLTALMILLFLGILALDRGCDGVDPPIDPDLDRGAVGAGRDNQHDDLGRPGAGGRHLGRRFDGDDREHPSPARGRPPLRPRRAGRRGRHRSADFGFDAWRFPACSSRSCSSTARRAICSRRRDWRWCSRCWPPMACRGR